MKKTLSFLFTFMLALSMTGCGEQGSDVKNNSEQQQAGTEINAENTGLANATTTTEESTETTETTETEETTEESSETTVAKGNGGLKKKDIKETYYEGQNELTTTHHYRFVPEDATELPDSINLGRITVDGKSFDITALANADADKSESIFNKNGVFSTEQLIRDKVFDDVNILEKWNPSAEKFICFQKKWLDGVVEITQKDFGLNNPEGIYDFMKVIYVDGSFGAIHSKSYAEHGTSYKKDKEYIIVNGEEKTFVEKDMGYQLTENNNRRITFTDKDIAVGDGTTYGDIVAMFGAEPINVDADFMIGEIYTYRNSTVTVGFVFAFPKLIPELEYKEMEDLTEEQKNSLPLIAVYMWLND